MTETFSDTYINVIAGGLLLLTQALPHRMRVAPDDADRHLRYDLGLDWVLAYSLWNFTFVYGTNPPGEPTGGMGGPSRWYIWPCRWSLMRGDANLYIQNRAYSLALLMMLAVTLPREPFFILRRRLAPPAGRGNLAMDVPGTGDGGRTSLAAFPQRTRLFRPAGPRGILTTVVKRLGRS